MNTANQNNPCERERVRSRSEKHLMKMCIGITGSFALFNLPVFIYSAIADLEPTCNNLQGILLLSGMALMKVNMAFDPLWYYYIQKRIQSNSS